MHPYRSEPSEAPQAPASVPGEEWALAAVLALIGAVRVALALARGEDFEAEVTIAAILGAIGCVLLAQLAMRSARARS